MCCNELSIFHSYICFPAPIAVVDAKSNNLLKINRFLFFFLVREHKDSWFIILLSAGTNTFFFLCILSGLSSLFSWRDRWVFTSGRRKSVLHCVVPHDDCHALLWHHNISQDVTDLDTHCPLQGFEEEEWRSLAVGTGRCTARGGATRVKAVLEQACHFRVLPEKIDLLWCLLNGPAFHTLQSVKSVS